MDQTILVIRRYAETMAQVYLEGELPPGIRKGTGPEAMSQASAAGIVGAGLRRRAGREDDRQQGWPWPSSVQAPPSRESSTNRSTWQRCGAEQVIRSAPVPVLTIRGDDH